MLLLLIVDAISKNIIYNAGEYYKIFVTYSGTAVQRAEWKKISHSKMKEKNKIMKQWNHQRRDRMLLKKRRGILQIILNCKRKEQNNTKHWIQQRIKIH